MDGWRFTAYLLVMAGVTYLLRAVPMLIFRRPIQNQFVLSVLYYAPFAVLGAMTFPDILYSTGSLLTAGIGLAVAFLAAWRKQPMALVALLGSIAAIIAQLIIGGIA